MSDIVQAIEEVRPLRDPALITGFLGQRRGGRLASNLLAHLVGEWRGQLVAKIQGEDFYDFTFVRPNIRINSGKSIIEWPEIDFFLANKEGSTRDLLIVTGTEPHLRWQTFTRAVIDYAGELGVRLLVNLRSFPGPVPHTRPAAIFPDSADREAAALFGVPRQGFKFEGLTDIGSVLSASGQPLGWRSVDLSVLQPYYLRPMPRAQANIALVRALDRAFGGETSVGAFQEAFEEERKLLNETNNDDEMQTLIRTLESQYDENVGWLNPASQVSELPSGKDILSEIERLIHEQQNPGDSRAD